MSRIYLPLLLLFILVIEGVALELLPTTLIAGDWMFVPHWLLVILLLTALLYDQENTYNSVMYAIFFGLLTDIVYTSVLGVYMFSYALVVYIIHGLRKFLQTNFPIVFLLTLLGIILADIGIYVAYFFIGANSLFWEDYITVRLFPTLVANAVFFLVIYLLFKRKMLNWSNERFEKAKSS